MTFAVTALNFTNAKALLKEGLDAVAQGECEYDLGALTQVDSASVAVIVAWQRAAVKMGKKISFINAPSGLINLADLYGVTALLNFVKRADVT